MTELTFGKGNMKLKKLAKHMGIPMSHVVAFDLPAGWTCPKADICKTFADKETGKMTKVGRVVCYACKAECSYPAVRAARWRNFDAIKACKTAREMANLIDQNLPKRAEVVRIHSSGDFFDRVYYEAWHTVACRRPEIQFFAYTKVLELVSLSRPDNFSMVYSYGSKDDAQHTGDVPTCYIRETPEQYVDVQTLCGAPELSHEDFYAIQNGETFVLDMH